VQDARAAYLLRCEDVEEARAIAGRDPLTVHGVMRPPCVQWELVGVNPAAIDPSLLSAQKTSDTKDSLHDFEAQMGRARGLNAPGPSEFDLLQSKILEQSYAVAQQDRDQVDLHLVQESRPQVLSHNVCASPDTHVLPLAAARACSRPVSISIRHEEVRRTALHGQRVPFLVGQHEDRPANGWRIAPRLEPDIEHSPADQNRSRRCVEAATKRRRWSWRRTASREVDRGRFPPTEFRHPRWDQ
jgi:hypothetical protein